MRRRKHKKFNAPDLFRGLDDECEGGRCLRTGSWRAGFGAIVTLNSSFHDGCHEIWADNMSALFLLWDLGIIIPHESFRTRQAWDGVGFCLRFLRMRMNISLSNCDAVPLPEGGKLTREITWPCGERKCMEEQGLCSDNVAVYIE